MFRTLRVVASGLLAGLLMGSLGMVIFVAAGEWDYRRRMSDTADEPPYLSAVWSALTEERTLPFWAVVAGVGAVNGGIGAWAGRRDSNRTAPVAVVPVLLVLSALGYWASGRSDPKGWGAELFVIAFVVLFAWVAGRVGQEVGRWQRPAEAAVAPDRASDRASGSS